MSEELEDNKNDERRREIPDFEQNDFIEEEIVDNCVMPEEKEDENESIGQCLRAEGSNSSLVVSDFSIDISDCSNDSYEKIDRKFNTINYCYTNARSLPPKLDSLIRVFDNFDLHFATVSETWMCIKRYKKNAENLESRDNLCIIKKSRKSRGGGVAIIFNKNKINLSQVKIRGNDFEIVGAIGRTSEDARKVLILSVYYPPQLKKEKIDRMNQCISDTIDKQKESFPFLQVILCGDFNKKDYLAILTDHPDLQVLDTPPTRGNEILDLCIHSLSGEISVKKIAPLSTEDEVVSDHDFIIVKSIAERKHVFEKMRFKYRPYSEEKSEAFAGMLAVFDWVDIHTMDVNNAVAYMNDVIGEMYRRCFPEKE